MNESRKELSPLEILRQETGLTQEEFAVKSKIPLATYRRMITKKPHQMKMSLQQIVNVCRISNVTLEQFFMKLGFDIKNL